MRPSRTSTTNAGWRCEHPGIGAELAPRKNNFSWLRPGPLIASRNDVLARWFGDPTDDQRREWLQGASGDRIVSRYADRAEISVALLGDPGEGDASQYVVVPVLEEVADYPAVTSALPRTVLAVDDGCRASPPSTLAPAARTASMNSSCSRISSTMACSSAVS